ncbi:MAG: hypothetical protein JRH16_02500 [Deltaproteobacteria bacterium]|nr:hypothetical protein [Deltaproteobacteria bacterium]MBW2362875.1 hypothetical protein [Deltaproteobacteria bacterium]
MLRDSCWLILVVAISAAAGVANAQETPERDLSDLARETPELDLVDQVKMRLKLQSEFAPDSDFGSFSIDEYRPEARLKITVPVSSQMGLRIIAGHSVEVFDFDGTSNLFGLGPTSSDPFDELHASTFRLQGAYLFEDCCALLADDERWSLLGEGFWKGRWEAGADLGSGSRGGGTLAVGYQIPGRLELALGVQVSSKLLSSGVGVSPVVEFKWKISDRWMLKSNGAGAQLEYLLRDGLTVFALGRRHSRSYRLDDRPGGVGKGRIRITRIPAGLGLRWNVLPWLRVTTTAGVLAWQELDLEDHNGDDLSDPTADPTPWFRLRFDFRPEH